MKIIRKALPDHLRFLVWVHLILVSIYTIFRAVTLMVNRPDYTSSAKTSISVWEAFKIGFQFDVLVASYALLAPYLVLTGAFIFNRESERLVRAVRFYCATIILVSIIICGADVPYFNFFNSRLTTAAVNWKNMGQSFKYIFSEIKYYPVILVSVFAIWGVGKLVRRIWNKTTTNYAHAIQKRITSTVLASGLLMFGLWGGAIPKIPTMESATFSNDGFVNQLTLNPVLTWFDSYFDFNINVVSLHAALEKVKKDFGIEGDMFDSPIAKNREFKQPPRKMNVVLVLIESMSANRMGIYGNERNLTPNLDSLCRNSVFFDQCYSNGIHTNAGIYSSIYGMPIMMMQHPMLNGHSETAQFTGLPVTLKDLGYETIFFCTHPKTFDNLDIFLNRNGFDMISDQFDYPDTAIANSWGVGDETLLEHAHDRLNKMAQDSVDKPFFATILTITTHPPFTLPGFTKFKPTRTDPVEITYEYTDWAIKCFMDSVAQEPWYKNTVFVFVGDHGVNIPGPYEVPLSYNHVPLIIHAPALFPKPMLRHDLANQTDIFPTIMGLLRQDYVQNTLGYDLFREKRPFAIFSQDLKMGVIDDQHLYIARKSGKETLFDYEKAFGEDILAKNKVLTDSMRNYYCSQLLVAEYMILGNKTGPQKAKK